jgi:hypothetical protein
MMMELLLNFEKAQNHEPPFNWKDLLSGKLLDDINIAQRVFDAMVKNWYGEIIINEYNWIYTAPHNTWATDTINWTYNTWYTYGGTGT